MIEKPEKKSSQWKIKLKKARSAKKKTGKKKRKTEKKTRRTKMIVEKL
jgi:hypothetical protein